MSVSAPGVGIGAGHHSTACTSGAGHGVCRHHPLAQPPPASSPPPRVWVIAEKIGVELVGDIGDDVDARQRCCNELTTPPMLLLPYGQRHYTSAVKDGDDGDDDEVA